MKVHEFMYEMRQTSAVLSRDSGIQVVFEGDQAKTDGTTIYLPSLPLNADLTDQQVKAMRGYVDHEAGHIKHTDMRRLHEFYDRNHNNGRDELSRIHNAIEDTWMQAKVMDEYPGAWKNMFAGHELIRKRELDYVQSDTDEAKQAVKEINEKSGESIASRIVHYNSDFREGTFNTELEQYLTNEQLNEWGERFAEEARKCETTEDAITLSKAIWKLLETPPESPDSMENQDPDEWDPQDAEPEDFDEGPNSAGYREWKEGDGMPGEGEGEGGEGEGEGQGQGKSKGNGKQEFDPNAQRSFSDILADGDDAGGGIGGLGDKRDSSQYKVFSTSDDIKYYPGKPQPNGSADYNRAVQATDPMPYERSKQNMQSHINVMRNKLKRALMARMQRDWDCGREMGRLDTRRLVQAANGSRTVFKQRVDREDEDTAICILIDLSGSMCGKKVETAQDCAVAMVECFEGTQFSVRVSGFSNRGHPASAAAEYRYGGSKRYYHRYERTDHIIFKDYGDPLRKTKGVIGEIRNCSGGNNSDFDFVQDELNTLMRRPEQRKVLFVLSDGHPACTSDYDLDSHTRIIRRTIGEYSKKGVECVGVGIMSNAVEEIYPEFGVVNKPEELSGEVFSKLTKILLGNKR